MVVSSFVAQRVENVDSMVLELLCKNDTHLNPDDGSLNTSFAQFRNPNTEIFRFINVVAEMHI